MSLRTRLTTAFLAVVLGPVLLGALVAAATVGAVASQRGTEQLDRATGAVVTSVRAMCRQLYAAASAVAIVPDADSRAAAAEQVLGAGLGSAVQVNDATGLVTLSTPQPPAQPWVACAGSDGEPAAGAAVSGGYAALAAQVELRAHSGAALGTVTVAAAVDRDFVARLAAASGAAVTQLRLDAAGGAGAGHSTEPTGARRGVLAAGERYTGDRDASTADGQRYVRRVGPGDGQPLHLLLSVPRASPAGTYAALVGVVVLTAGLAVALAAWLARNTTRPLATLAAAADRFADGDLAARVPAGGSDEVGRLAATFNRMTRETQAYVQALTASRDQLRGHLEILGDTLSSTHDLDRILRVILQTAMAATSAQAGVVLLADDGDTLLGKCGEGLATRLPEAVADGVAGLRVSPGAGVLGVVAATGVPRRGRVAGGVPALSPTEPRCRSYVAVPFALRATVGDEAAGAAPARRTAGLLAVYDRLGAEEFDDADLSTLRTFAGQAAVAVDNVRAHEEAHRLSLTDPLTGLWNYRYLQEAAHREVERATRFDRTLTALALDIDRFKRINDTYGHRAGDAVLVEFARRLRLGVREVDAVFRQGGEEFVVLLPETDRAGGEVVAQRLGALIRDTPVTVAGRTPGSAVRIPVTTSVGIAVFPAHAASTGELLDVADRALYAAKSGGRDTYRLAGAARPAVPARPRRPAGEEPAAAAAGGRGAPGEPHPATPPPGR
ncbi:hypothetical protein GCM10010124_24100 [Pilimelia terevasa]|uniref:Diguanylate cyclase n=1 Tax=Pilimelia terevasa TaxID=53372 RepID=A0A8J3BUS4_9ACTN|nr:diguanylate cyclase [Pilimelia terevasa]GGK30486.1 hypothetical protein GCM10010124_24100 [Pilimelia terevasa]